ncbi:MAG TPA: sulfatase-like hydrolase/transferase [Chthoniobacteraceae bacterium]|nr:sulfatase-like hydrolase/transferase [Chthoniobacteraceae bacterium]
MTPDSNRRPNILFCMTDAQIHRALGCAGNREVRTPHLDALAAEGVHFRQAYACSPVCGPSRAAMMSGRYPIAYGMVNNFGCLPPSEPTLGQLFSAAGYRTGYFGKTHYGRSNDAMREEGWEAQFLLADYNRYLRAAGVPHEYPRNLVAESRTRYWKMGTSKIPLEHYFEKVLGDRAVEFVRSADERPFLCFLSMIAPHGPFSPPAPYDRMYDPASLTLFPRSEGELEGKPAEFVRWVTQNRKYVTDAELREFLAITYGLVSLADDTVGRLVAALKTAGVYDNTVIVFASDHGDYGSKYGILGKSWCMDDVLSRIPLIISHPDHRGEGRTSDALVENIDLLPTLLESGSIPVPRKVQGRSLLPILSGSRESVKEAVFSFHSSEYSEARLNLSMIRRGEWKLVQSDTDENQLYHLPSDPYEWKNRIDEPELHELVRSLQYDLLRCHVANTGQSFPIETTRFWTDETYFYDETRFNGSRQITRSGEWESTTS